MAIGAGVSTLGTIQSASAASANAQFQQKIALDNANRTSEQMRDAYERGADEEQQVMAEGARVMANTRGALATNNMDLTYGSPLDTIIQSNMEMQRDAYRVRRNTSYEVRDLQVKRSNYVNSAAASGAEAANAKTAGFIAGVGTALSGGSDIYRYKASIE
tara:strand:+ start:3881 stop:4360 length:480 start_codon:yes stop_codon:yes gene_type:complete